MDRKMLSEEDEELLINFYEQNPSLWKFADAKYKCTKDKILLITDRLLPTLSNKTLEGNL